jgi:AraC-like DNA-binding protein
VLHEIRKYPVQHPLLKNYIKFFWELRVDHLELHHKLIPQRNINLRFNLSDTPHILSIDGNEHILESTYFSGLHDHFINTYLKLTGEVHTLGICFFPQGFYPFMKIPVVEFKNQVLGTNEVGCKYFDLLSIRLREAPDIASRLSILESELVQILVSCHEYDELFQKIFIKLRNCENSMQISAFCAHNGISLRNFERMFNKYVGVPANTYSKLNRFHTSMNQLIGKDFSKLSDLAYDHGYFDQMHFIRDFKRFAGDTPRSFVNQNKSILQIGKLA